MTFKEMVAFYVEDVCGSVEDAVVATLTILGALFIITIGFVFVWKFTLLVLTGIAALVGLFALFAWAADEL